MASAAVAFASASFRVAYSALWNAIPRCVEVRDGDRRRGVAICLASYDRTGQERDLAWAAKAYLDPPHADWPWEIACARAELAEQRGGSRGDRLAEDHYRRSTAMVAALRSTARARSAYLVSSHRGPYDGRIALHARSGRWRDALAVVLDLDASDMLRATAVERVVRGPAPPDVETPAPRSIMSPASTVEDVLAAWRSRDLVIVIAQSERQVGRGRETMAP